MKQFDFSHAVWNQPQKVEYRHNCIILPFQKFFGINRLPDSRYYWSICGTNTNGVQAEPLSEIGQITSSNLISFQQFVGIDRSEEIIAANKQAWPLAQWYCGEFSEILHSKVELPPMVIHADTTVMTTNADAVLLDSMALVEHIKQPCMIVLNTISKRWIDAAQLNPVDLISRIVRQNIDDHWSIATYVYEYRGGVSKSGRAVMSAYMLFYA